MPAAGTWIEAETITKAVIPPRATIAEDIMTLAASAAMPKEMVMQMAAPMGHAAK